MFYAPPKVKPLEYKGMRFQQDRDSSFDGRELAATYLSAVDINDGRILWCIKICDPLRYQSPKEIATVDFSKLWLGPGEDELIIETVIDTQYHVDLQTRTVTQLPRRKGEQKQSKAVRLDPLDPPMPPPMPRRRKR